MIKLDWNFEKLSVILSRKCLWRVCEMSTILLRHGSRNIRKPILLSPLHRYLWFACYEQVEKFCQNFHHRINSNERHFDSVETVLPKYKKRVHSRHVFTSMMTLIVTVCRVLVVMLISAATVDGVVWLMFKGHMAGIWVLYQIRWNRNIVNMLLWFASMVRTSFVAVTEIKQNGRHFSDDFS